MESKTPPYAPLAVDFAFSSTTDRLRSEFGWEGVIAWVFLIAAAKRNAVAGEISYSSDAEFWQTLGMDEDPPAFTPDAFLAFLGRLKQTSKHVERARAPRAQGGRRGRALRTHVWVTNFGRWNQTDRRWKEAERKRRKREQSGADTERTDSGHAADTPRTDFIVQEEKPKASLEDKALGGGQPPDAAPKNGATPATEAWTAEELRDRFPEALAWVQREGWHIARPQLAFRLNDDYGVTEPDAIAGLLHIATDHQEDD